MSYSKVQKQIMKKLLMSAYSEMISVKATAWDVADSLREYDKIMTIITEEVLIDQPDGRGIPGVVSFNYTDGVCYTTTVEEIINSARDAQIGYAAMIPCASYQSREEKQLPFEEVLGCLGTNAVVNSIVLTALEAVDDAKENLPAALTTFRNRLSAQNIGSSTPAASATISAMESMICQASANAMSFKAGVIQYMGMGSVENGDNQIVLNSLGFTSLATQYSGASPMVAFISDLNINLPFINVESIINAIGTFRGLMTVAIWNGISGLIRAIGNSFYSISKMFTAANIKLHTPYDDYSINEGGIIIDVTNESSFDIISTYYVNQHAPLLCLPTIGATWYYTENLGRRYVAGCKHIYNRHFANGLVNVASSAGNDWEQVLAFVTENSPSPTDWTDTWRYGNLSLSGVNMDYAYDRSLSECTITLGLLLAAGKSIANRYYQDSMSNGRYRKLFQYQVIQPDEDILGNFTGTDEITNEEMFNASSYYDGNHRSTIITLLSDAFTTAFTGSDISYPCFGCESKLEGAFSIPSDSENAEPFKDFVVSVGVVVITTLLIRFGPTLVTKARQWSLTQYSNFQRAVMDPQSSIKKIHDSYKKYRWSSLLTGSVQEVPGLALSASMSKIVDDIPGYLSNFDASIDDDSDKVDSVVSLAEALRTIYKSITQRDLHIDR